MAILLPKLLFVIDDPAKPRVPMFIVPAEAGPRAKPDAFIDSRPKIARLPILDCAEANLFEFGTVPIEPCVNRVFGLTLTKA